MTQNIPLMLARLQGLLARQLELVQQDNLVAAEGLAGEIDAFIRAIAATDALNAPGCHAQRQSIEGIYNQLCLTLAAHRDGLSRELNAIRRAKTLLKTYGKNLSTT